MSNEVTIMIVAGEASGDTHGAKLVNELRKHYEGRHVSFFGTGGGRLRKAGLDAVVADELSVVGLPEIARALPMFLRAFKRLISEAERRRPDAVVLIDFPDFNLRLAKALKRRGFKVIYYISPQLWAWRKYRKRAIARYVDLLITILPFEKAWYAEQGIRHVEYVGSPLAREVHPSMSRDEFCRLAGLDPMRKIVSLLPGSRQKEIARILPEMLKAAGLMLQREPSMQFVIALAANRSEDEVQAAFANAGIAHQPTGFRVVRDAAYDALNASDAAAVTSGTATLEAGIIGTPTVIVYKTSAFNYRLLRPLISVEHFGLVNLIAGERVAAELIQDDLTAKTLSDELFRLLEPQVNTITRERLKSAADKLGHGGASARAAELIAREIELPSPVSL